MERLAATIAILLFLVLLFGGKSLVNLIEGRRRFLLDLKKEDARIAEAKARELEVQQKRAELEYREALLELERFDRRTTRELRRPRPDPDPADPADRRDRPEPPEPPARPDPV